MSQDKWIGKTIDDRYQIEALLGKGGMSAVYRGLDPNLRRQVAIKLIHTHLSDNPEFVRRFEEEAAAVARLRHPNIIQVYDFDHDNDLYYIVFEYIPGESLQERLLRLNSNGVLLPLQKSLTITSSIGQALAYAHQAGLVHRDIKPANIMLNQHEEAILMDFGIAKIEDAAHQTATGVVLGTARYMSPEQVMGENIDARTDIYALGVTLFEMVSGRPPYEANSAATLMVKHLNEPIPDVRELRPDVPTSLVAIINTSLAKNSASRYQSADQMVADLKQVISAINPGTATVETPLIATQITAPAAGASAETVVESTASVLEATAVSESTPRAVTPPSSTPPKSKRNLLIAAGAFAVVLLIILAFFALRPDSETSPNSFDSVSSGAKVRSSAGEPTDLPADVSANETGAQSDESTDSPFAVQSGAQGAGQAATAVPEADFDPLFLTSYTYDGLIVAVGLPAVDTERILFSIDDPEPKIDNGRSSSGTLTLPNNSIGPLPLEKGDHTLYVQYVDAAGVPGEIYTFDYHIDDIVINFSQLPTDPQTEGFPAIFTMAVVDGNPDALFSYAYSVDSETLDQRVDGVGQAGVIQLAGLEAGEHTLYVQAKNADGETAVVAYPFTIE